MYTNASTSFFHSDDLGTERVRATVAGTVDDTCTSMPFGDNQSCSGEPLGRFAGYERDSEYGLAHAPARYDSPTLGRVISEDPAGLLGGIDPQAYAGGAPVDGSDPTSLWLKPAHTSTSGEAIRRANWPGDSEALAKAVADVDNGTQGTGSYDTNTHGIAGRKQNGNWHSCNEAYEGTKQQIGEDVRSGAINRAMHTIEDAWDPVHAGYPRWYGADAPVRSAIHGVGDAVAPLDLPAYYAARDAATRFLGDLGGEGFTDPANYLPQNPCH